jgi:hypothetical protein
MLHSIQARVLLLALLIAPFAAAAENHAASVPGLTAAPDVVIPDKPIASRDQLDAYQRDTPPGQSPLNWLTPGGKQRFLSSIIFGERGVGGFSTEDLSYDLTRQQAFYLLKLFGSESYAINLDARTAPRPAAAVMPSSALEQNYDELVAAADTGDHTLVIHLYATHFAPSQSDAQRHALNDADMLLLFRATDRVADITSDASYLNDLRADKAELEQRHLIDRPQAGSYYDALVRMRQTDEARAFLAAHPSLDRNQPPVMRLGSRIHKGQPSLWVPSLSRHELVRFRFNTHAPSQIIVLGGTGCHYCIQAARALEADPMLRGIFQDYAQWVASSAELGAFEEVREWNRTYPEMRLGINYDDRELPMIKQFETPTFFFLDHGTVVDTVKGWPDGGNLEAIRSGLRKIDLLR